MSSSQRTIQEELALTNVDYELEYAPSGIIYVIVHNVDDIIAIEPIMQKYPNCKLSLIESLGNVSGVKL